LTEIGEGGFDVAERGNCLILIKIVHPLLNTYYKMIIQTISYMVNKLKAVKHVLVFLLPLFLCLQSQAQHAIEKRARLADSSFGVVISAHQFDYLVKTLLTKFESDTSEKKIKDYLLLIKVGNTIEFDHLFDSSREFKELNDLYLYKYMKKIVQLTDATLSYDYSYYSKKYDIQIGGVKTKNNFYRIVN
jgi:hypothetical protein